MLSTDLVAELRAEVTRWWELTCKHRREQEAASTSASTTSQLSASSSSSSVITPILGAMLVEGPMRMITLGQELSVDVDEKTLAEMQFKDSQVRSFTFSWNVINNFSAPGKCLKRNKVVESG